jgi:ABC-type multidrug transport system fused ATPase/permease subunit
MSRLFIINEIFLKHKYKLLLTYALFCIEMLAVLLRPLFLGMAIDGLVKNDFNGLILLASAQIVYMMVGTLRHMHDTQTYTGIYNSLVNRLFARRVHQPDVSKLSAHSTLAREFVDFLEFDIKYIVEAIYNLVGSVIVLMYFDSKVALICVVILIPVSILSHFYGKSMMRLNKFKNDELEKQVEVITNRNADQIKEHYHKLRKWQIKISNREAINFGLMELISLGAITASLLISVKTHVISLQAGELIGIYLYVFSFISGLETIPYTIQRVTNLKDIMNRIEVETDAKPPLLPVNNLKPTGLGKITALQ